MTLRTGDSNSLVAMASFTAHPLDLGDTGRPYSSDSGPSSDNVTDAGANAYVLRSPTPTSRNTTSHKSVKSPSENIKCEDGRLDVDILIGDKSKDSPHVGVLGTLSDDSRKLAISLVKPQCLAVLGYMGSGKSYALGVLIENALLRVPNLINHSRPLSVVAFNFRRNPEARFEYGGFACRNSDAVQRERLNTQYIAGPAAIQQVNVFAFAPEIERRQHEYTGLRQYPIQFLSEELGAEHWEILMKPPTAQAEYMDIIRDIIQKLYYADRLTYRNLERQIENDERLSDSQRRRAMNRLSFAERWICDDRKYEWSDVLAEGVLNIVDLRMQTLEPSEALKLCLIVTDLVRRTRNGVNKVIVFDEAHEYVDSKQLVSELENAITQIRHDGLSFVLASQFPDRIPERIFKYLLTRLIFKLPHSKGVNYLRKMAANLASLSSYQVGNLDLEQGVCLIQTDDDCTDVLLRRPQLLQVRPRCTQHGGATVRQTDANFTAEAAPVAEPEPSIGDDPSEDNGKTLAELNDEFGISWNRFLALLTLPTNAGLTPDMTLAEARRVAANGRH